MASEKLQKFIGGVIGVLIIIGGIALILNYIESRPWKGMIDLNSGKQLNKDFKTLEDCREWAEKEAKKLDLAIADLNYKCGLNCQYDNNTPVVNDYVCSELTR